MSREVTDVIIGFLREIGLEISEAEVADDTFLPGILVARGILVVDRDKLKYPGDLLHEAGHLAVMPTAVRRTLSDKVEPAGVAMDPIEAQAIAWSYAAAKHLAIDPRVVFHEYGYKGNAESILRSFEMGVYFGVQGLIDRGLTDPLSSPEAYPKMRAWLAE